MRSVLFEVDLPTLAPTRADVGDIVYPPGGRFGPRFQRSLELMIIQSGSARVWIDDRPPMLVPADWVSLQLPGHRERYEFDDDMETHEAWVEFELDDYPSSLLEQIATLPLLLPTSGALASLVADAIAVTRTPLATAQPLVASLAAATIWRFVGEAASSVRGGDDAVDRAQRVIATRLDDPTIDLGEIAQAAHVSPSHLVRRFRAELGVTPMAYLWQRRTATGIDLLRTTGLPIGDVAVRAGFASVYHFSRKIKAQTGMSPTELRRERWSPAGGGDDE